MLKKTKTKPTAAKPARIPNAATREAMRAADAGELTRYAGAAELFEKLGP